MLEELLSKNEGKTLEFKENTNNLKSILRSIVAFSNTAGGTILIGIRDKSKEILGVSNPLLDEEKLANAISDNIAPLVVPGIEILSYRSRELRTSLNHLNHSPNSADGLEVSGEYPMPNHLLDDVLPQKTPEYLDGYSLKLDHLPKSTIPSPQLDDNEPEDVDIYSPTFNLDPRSLKIIAASQN